jgi:tetratricopeptide (TPR) repeat protein
MSLNPRNTTLHYRLGNLYKRNGESDLAIDQYQKGPPFQSGFVDALDNLAMVYTLKMEYDKAISLFIKIIGLRSDPASNYYNIACIYARQNQIEESINWLKKAISKGYSKWDLIETDIDLENIKGSSYYIEITREH